MLASVADDYEDLSIITQDVTNWAKDRNILPARRDIIRAIEVLIINGHVQSYLLSEHAPHSTAVKFDPSRVDDLYYYVTSAGKKIVKNPKELGVKE